MEKGSKKDPNLLPIEGHDVPAVGWSGERFAHVAVEIPPPPEEGSYLEQVEGEVVDD